ncbi:PREDICTED: four-domain proteases inhibitor-like [Branchiostoma belcheri]|uniref:Four-domain proteases inhibitor-like n=1 Tax=Branchiostoma belcheri TaxID=7741 RepID=A0A6P5A1A5_BRABE|nr:PREDICTED: four-domain proteases inhibitor-like [Branchiostoma belcheri]
MVILRCLLAAVLLAGSQAKSVRQNGCPFFCPFIHMPVCGSDAVTYGNQCELEIAACQLAAQFSNEPDFEPLTTAYHGACGSVRDDAKRQFDLWDLNSGCPMICPAHYSPICGSNGLTYGNMCELNAASCVAEANNLEPITVAYHGDCNGGGIFEPFEPLMVS